jgi:hypothetical protein
LQHVAELSQAAHSSAVQALVVSFSHSVQQEHLSSTGCELLLQAHDDAANIAATIANDINTFFMTLNFNG